MFTIMGVDPGGTTGICICRLGEQEIVVVYHGQWKLQDLITGNWSAGNQLCGLMSTVDITAMESVVASGMLTAGKIDQIKAEDRIFVESSLRNIEVAYITPEERKRVKQVPKEVKGDHARDAYRVAVAYLWKVRLYEANPIPE